MDAGKRSETSTPWTCVAVAVGGGPSSAHWHDVERGIAAAAVARGWRLVGDLEGNARSRLDRLRNLDCDGLIAEITTPAEARAAERLGVPAVNVSEVMAATSLPLVTFDNPAIGRLAADHLLHEGYVHFAFYGMRDVVYAAKRERAFAEAVTAAGFECTVLEAPSMFHPRGTPPANLDLDLDRWLLSLPPRTGILAASDTRAAVLLDSCRRLGIDVPGRLGVLGVGDCRDLCTAAPPPLSSIRRDGGTLGERAVTVLAGMIDGDPRAAADCPILVPPEGVSTRSSTACGDADAPLAARAVTLVRDHIREDWTVDQLARRLQVSRRKLERAFHDAFGEGPRGRIMRVRAEAALAARDGNRQRPLAAIAREHGFTDARHLRRILDRLGIEADG